MDMAFVQSKICCDIDDCSEATCLCVSNYYGEHCEKVCEDDSNCSGNGMCLHNGKCMCNEGFKGEQCEEEGSSFVVSPDLILTIILLSALAIQLYLFYRQTVTIWYCF